MIEDIIIKKRSIIPDDKGRIMHIMKSTDDNFKNFGEVYCSTIYPGVIKGWNMHKKMTLNYILIKGEIKLVLYDDRSSSNSYKKKQEINLDSNKGKMITIPPLIWVAFQCISSYEAFLINFTNIPHDRKELVKMNLKNNIINHNW